VDAGENCALTAAEFPADDRGAEGAADHQVQRLRRGDAGRAVRPHGRQAMDAPDAQGQGAFRALSAHRPVVLFSSGSHSQGAQRVQEHRNGGPRGEQALYEVRFLRLSGR